MAMPARSSLPRPPPDPRSSAGEMAEHPARPRMLAVPGGFGAGSPFPLDRVERAFECLAVARLGRGTVAVSPGNGAKPPPGTLAGLGLSVGVWRDGRPADR